MLITLDIKDLILKKSATLLNKIVIITAYEQENGNKNMFYEIESSFILKVFPTKNETC